jgi:KUP system potassium uptake protein
MTTQDEPLAAPTTPGAAVPAPAVPAASTPAAESGATEGHHAQHRHGKAGSEHGSLMTLALGSIGVVYGDIGTSPLYALREALHHAAEDGLTRDEVLGVVSLLLWAVTIIVTLKYVLMLMRADNKGEGGILSLLALVQGVVGRNSTFIMVLAALGASLFYSDAVITPAISVLSAVEGLKLVTPVFEPYVLPATLLIITALFLVQPWGTGAVAVFFGPITALWFVTMAVAGLYHVSDDPGILLAFNPAYAVSFLLNHGLVGFVVLGSVFLAVTGAEALYADMGHFGRKPIQAAWFALVFPALALNYLGQGALVLAHPEALDNPFFLLFPTWMLLPIVLLATVATVIASQAVISGAFSVTRQAVQLGLLPRLQIRHTSETQAGQIYMPRVNWMLLAGVLLLVLMFKTSSSLAAAYGIAVTGDMVITSCLAFFVLWKVWNRSLAVAAAIVAPFLVVEVTFLAANLLKIFEGAWLPLIFATCLVTAMWTWVRGTRIVFEKSRKESVPLAAVVRMLERSKPYRAPGTAVFLTSDPETAPAAMMHNLKHNNVLHKRNIVMTIRTATTPRVPEKKRIVIREVSADFTVVEMTFGYMEDPSVAQTLAACRSNGLKLELMSTTFFVSRRSFRASGHSGMPLWQDHIFLALARSASDAAAFYRVPSNRLVEIGQQFVI